MAPMPATTDRFFVLTGGPGSGKTTLLDALAARGIGRTHEAGRAIIRDQVATGGHALPWVDKHAFAELMLRFERRTYEEAAAVSGPVVFDRGIPDVVGYRRLCGLPALAHVDEAAQRFRYNRRVLVAPTWPDIFVQDSERKQTLQEAELTYEAITAAYKTHGYELVILPQATVEERVAFTLAFIERESSSSSRLRA